MIEQLNIKLLEKIPVRRNKYKKYFKDDPVDAKCPHCGESGKPCSYINSLARAWARSACARKNNK